MSLSFNDQTNHLSVKNLPSSDTAKPVANKKFFNFTSWRAKFFNIPNKEKIFFVQQLGIMIQTGISLAVAMKTLSDQTKNKNFKIILNDLQKNIERGNLFSQGLEKYQKVFGELFINMVRAGEQSGRLEDVLKQLFIQMKKDHEIVSKVRGAMIYPSIVISAMIIIGTLVIVYVIPNLVTVFDEVKADLPLATKVLIGISDFTTQYGIFLLVGVIIGIFIFLRFIHIPQGKYIFHKFLLALPIFGGIIRKINLARFSRTLSSLLKTDIAIVTSFEITSKVLGNYLYRQAIQEAKEKIKKGQSIHDALDLHRSLFPPVVLQMVNVGEETGALDTILEQSAVFFEDDVDQTMKNLPTIIEPILILILGLGVAGMAVAVIMPLYSLTEQI